MKHSSTAVIAVLMSIAVTASVALAQSVIEDALGGPIVECRGALAWAPEQPESEPRVEAMQLAARDDSGAKSIALYHIERDFTPEDLWSCSEGLCTAHRVLRSGVSSSVLRIARGFDLGRGRVEYAVEAVFSVVGASGEALEPASTTGKGAFICDKALPNSVVSSVP